MYISKIIISNFRNFKNKEICFNENVNVIIGHNNAGKSNLIKALSLVLDTESKKRLELDDFNKNITLAELKQSPPSVSITVILAKGVLSTPDDLATISTWLTTLEEDYEASLTYTFFLPEKYKEDYLKAIAAIDESDNQAIDKAWRLIRHDFIRLYTHKILGGEIINQTTAESEFLQKFDFQFLDAIRDVERDMLTGRNTLLKDVLDFFLDYDIKSESTKTKEDKEQEIKLKRQAFSEKAGELLDSFHERMTDGKGQILSYAKETGASFNKAEPNFEGHLTEIDMFSVLRLIIEHETGIKIPATHNGLGYNNLIFMSLLLAKMQVNSNGEYLGSNAKVFSTLAIEEPEAHLHPAMQYKFLQFLRDNKNQKKVRQIFVTTHSTHITSAVSLDEIICLYNDDSSITNVGYPGKIFSASQVNSKKYIQRFLDATKSDMLFAQKVILVEGIAEQLLISIFAKYLGKSLEDHHVAVINIGGRYFNHFLQLFDMNCLYAIRKKVACITDKDPERKEKKAGAKFQKCYPFEYNCNPSDYDYKINQYGDAYSSHTNISFFTQGDESGKTFEYELAFANPASNLLQTESIGNSNEIKTLMELYSSKEPKPLSDFLDTLRDGTDENQRIKACIEALDSSKGEDYKKRSIIASRYLNSVGKGENALELAVALMSNLEKKGTPEFEDFNVPEYVKNAIEWICN